MLYPFQFGRSHSDSKVGQIDTNFIILTTKARMGHSQSFGIGFSIQTRRTMSGRRRRRRCREKRKKGERGGRHDECLIILTTKCRRVVCGVIHIFFFYIYIRPRDTYMSKSKSPTHLIPFRGFGWVSIRDSNIPDSNCKILS